jgi:hypothetical protein
MSFPLLFTGVLLLAAGIRGTQNDLFALVKRDFTGPANFFYWLLVIGAIGAIGYIRPLRPLSRGFLVLLVVVIALTRANPNLPGGGFFAQLLRQVGTTVTPPVQSSPVGNTPPVTVPAGTFSF